MLRASVRRVPLAGQSQTVCMPEGATLAQLVETAFPDAFLRRFVVAFVGGVEIAQDAWAELKPRAGDFINLCIRPGDGDSGVGKVLRTVLQIAVIAAAAWVGGMIGGIPGMLASAAISMAGNFIINSLIPLSPLTAKGEAPAPFYTVTGARNTAKVYAPASFVLGKHRFFPPLYGRYVQETVGNDVYLRVPFCLGPAPVQYSEPKIGDTPLSSFAGVEVEERLTATAPDHTLYTGDPDQDPVGAQLTTTATARNTAPGVDEIEVVLGFRGGLGGYDSKQRKVSKTVAFEIRYRPAGTADAWQTHRPTVPQANEASAAAGVPFRPDYFLSLPNLTAYIGQLAALGDVPTGPVTVTRADPGRGFQHVVRFAVPRHEDGYEVDVRRTTAESADPNTIDAVWWEILGSVKSYVDPFPEKDLASIVLRIKASAQLSGVIDSFNAIVEPIVPLFSAGAKAAPESASAASLTTTGPSRNHAEIVLNLYRGPQAARPRPDDRIDWPAWAAFAAHCEALGLHYDEVIDVTIGRGELARRICASAFARPIRWGGKLSVVIDRDRTGEAPAQVFTPRNVANLQWRKTFPLDVHAVRIAFNNADNGYQADEVTLYLDGYDATNATKFETLNVSGKTDPDEVRTVGRQFINNSLRQTETFAFDMDAEALTCRPGAYAVLLHDAIGVGLAAHRVKAVETSGANVTAFTLDFEIPTEAADAHAARWRKEDGAGGFEVATEATVTRDGANAARFVFGTPKPVASAPAVGDMVLIGIAEEVALPVLVRDVAPDFGHRASVTVIPYAGERFTPDGDPLPPHDPMVQLPIAARPATPVQLTVTANAREIALAFFQGSSPRSVTLTGFETAVREHGNTADSWQDRGPLPADARVFVAPPGNPGYSYDLRVVAVGNDSGGLPVRSDPLIVENIAAAVSPVAPTACGAGFSTRTSPAGAAQLVLNAYWLSVDDPDVLDTRVEMLVSTGPDVWREIGQGRAALGQTEVHGLAVGRSYTLSFVHLSRRGIASARTTIAPITAPDTLIATGAMTAVTGSPLDTAIGSMASAAASAAAADAARIAAQTAQTAAAGSASAAAGSASTSAAQASAAAASASAAAASLVSAQAARDTSNITAAQLLPATFEQDSAFWTHGETGSASTNAGVLSGTFPVESGIGKVYQQIGFGSGTILPRGVIAAVPGRTFELEAVARVTVDSTLTGGTKETATATSWRTLDASHAGATGYVSATPVSGFIGSKSVFRAADGWVTFKVRYTVPASPSFAYLRPRFYNGFDAGGNGNATWQVRSFKIADVTDVVAAEMQALASATSASAAGASQTAAGVSASAANTSATNAATQAGNASASAGTATTQASNALTQANNAAASATAASNSLLSARAVANRLLPSKPGEDPEAFTHAWNTFAPGNMTSGSAQTVAGEGKVWRISGQNDIATKGFLPVVNGRTLRVTHRSQVVTDGTGTNQWQVWIRSFDASGTYLAAHVVTSATDAAVTASEGWQTLTGTLTMASILAAQPTAAYVRLDLRGGHATGSVWECSLLLLEDATATATAEASASAAAASQAAASASQASATSSATLSANYASGAGVVGLLPNPKFMTGVTGGIPNGWANGANATGGTQQPRPGVTGAYMYRLAGGASTNNTIKADTLGATQGSVVAGRKYYVRASTILGSGTYNGAGVMVEFYDASNALIGSPTAVSFANTANTAGVTANNHAGLTTWDVPVTAPAGAVRAVVFACSHHSSLSGGNGSANSIDWYEVDLVAEGYASAMAQTNAGAIAGINSTAAFWETVVAAGGGDLAAVRLKAGASGSYLELISTVLRLANISNGAIIEVMRAVGGEAYFSRPLSADGGGKRVTVGPGYGVAGSEVVLWFGPDTIAPSLQSRVNGYFALGTDGKVYFGAADLATQTGAVAVFTKTLSLSSFATSGTTAVTIGTIDVNAVPSGGFIKIIRASLPLGSYTLSAGTSWTGNIIVTEDLQAGGAETTLLTLPVTITDTGGGFFDVLYNGGDVTDVFPTIPVAHANSGNVRYRMKLQRTGVATNNITASPTLGQFIIERTPG